MPAGSKMDPPLAKAKPISASVITYLRRKTKELKEVFATRERSEKMQETLQTLRVEDDTLEGTSVLLQPSAEQEAVEHNEDVSQEVSTCCTSES
ncbi:junction-mediating and -regulatory protein-like [Grus japonensis]|uniref:Junction-mediating and -regulatory protein-like n=1 Tax=Grus japonensis TaxID=30415 RepID=A0ABC9W354_GRUJA